MGQQSTRWRFRVSATHTLFCFLLPLWAGLSAHAQQEELIALLKKPSTRLSQSSLLLPSYVFYLLIGSMSEVYAGEQVWRSVSHGKPFKILWTTKNYCKAYHRILTILMVALLTQCTLISQLIVWGDFSTGKLWCFMGFIQIRPGPKLLSKAEKQKQSFFFLVIHIIFFFTDDLLSTWNRPGIEDRAANRNQISFPSHPHEACVWWGNKWKKYI